MTSLRTELSRLTVPPSNVGLEWLDQQIEEIAELHRAYPHDIELITPSSYATADLNCFMYALALEPNAVRDMCQEDSMFPGAEFVQFLVMTIFKSKEVPSSEAVDGDIVIYFDAEGTPTHAGIYRNGRVLSKWGAGRTHIWEHGVFEVPANYGDHIRVFKPITPEKAVKAFTAWASNHGF